MAPPNARINATPGTDNENSPLSAHALGRRAFLARTALVTAAISTIPALLGPSRRAEAAVLPQSAVVDTINGVLAFVVPGADAYSVQQGLIHGQPGAVEANATLPLMFGLNAGGIAPPPFDSLSEMISALLNNVAMAVHPNGSGPFQSAFANLTFAEKAVVFNLMESGAIGPGLDAVANSLILYAGLMAYSEAGALDPFTLTLLAPPVGWQLAGYGGVSDGHKDFQGYYQGRRFARG